MLTASIFYFSLVNISYGCLNLQYSIKSILPDGLITFTFQLPAIFEDTVDHCALTIYFHDFECQQEKAQILDSIMGSIDCSEKIINLELSNCYLLNSLKKRVSISGFKFPLFEYEMHATMHSVHDHLVLKVNELCYTRQNYIIKPTAQLQELKVLELTSLTISYDEIGPAVPGLFIELQFPNYYNYQVHTPFSHIERESLSCQTVSGLTDNLLCSMNENVLTIQLDPLQQIKQTNQISFKVFGYRNCYFAKSIQVKLLVYQKYNNNHFLITSGEFKLISIGRLEQMMQIEPLDTRIQKQTDYNFIIPIKFYISSHFLIKIVTDSEIIEQQSICLKNCIQSQMIATFKPEFIISFNSVKSFINEDVIIKQIFVNHNLPSKQNGYYEIHQLIDGVYVIIQSGKGSYLLKPNLVFIESILLSNYEINQSPEVKVEFSVDFEIHSNVIIIIHIPNEIQLPKNTIMFPEQNFQNSYIMSMVLNGLKNPSSPQVLSGWKIEIQNYQSIIAMSQNDVQVPIIIAKLYIVSIDIGILANQMGCYYFVLETNENLVDWTQLVIQTHQSNFNPSSSSEELICSIQTIELPCFFENGIITVKNSKKIEFLKQQTLSLTNFQYPRSQRPINQLQIKIYSQTTLVMASEINEFSTSLKIQEFNQLKAFTQGQNELIFQFNSKVETYLSDSFKIQFLDSFPQIVSCELFGLEPMEYLWRENQIEIKPNKVITPQETQILKLKYSNLNILDFPSVFLEFSDSEKYSIMQEIIQIDQNLGKVEEIGFSIFEVLAENRFFNSNSDYNFIFQANFILPKDSIIILQIPTYLEINQSECDYSNGFLFKSCSQDENNRNEVKIQLTQNTELSNFYYLRLKNVKNPSYFSDFSSGQYYITSMSKNQQIVATKNFFDQQSYLCRDQTCLVCSNDDQCQECSQDKKLYHGQCIDSCPPDTVDIRSQCLRCNTLSSCENCSNQDPSICLKCAPGYNLQNGTCLWSESIQQLNQTEISQTLSIFQEKKIMNPIDFFQTIAFLIFSLTILIRKVSHSKVDPQSLIIIFISISENILVMVILIYDILNQQYYLIIFQATILFINIAQLLYGQTLFKQFMDNDLNFLSMIQNRLSYKIIQLMVYYFDARLIVIFSCRFTNDEIYDFQFENYLQISKLFQGHQKLKLLTFNVLNLSNIIYRMFHVKPQMQKSYLIRFYIEYTCFFVLFSCVQGFHLYKLKNVSHNSKKNEMYDTQRDTLVNRTKQNNRVYPTSYNENYNQEGERIILV